MTPDEFVKQLVGLRFDNAFNPYRDKCGQYDLEGAPQRRANLLQNVLEAAIAMGVDSIWVGRDLGHRGGRRTGLALTDDVHFHAHLARWRLKMNRPTIGQPVREMTAGAIWQMLHRIDRPIFLWNVYPLHPHAPGNSHSNRLHNANERAVGVEILSELISLLRPSRLVALGNDAQRALEKHVSDIPVTKVRHPSYGGQAEFRKQISSIYNIQKGSLL